MTIRKRIMTILGLVVAALLAGTVAASAAYKDTAALPQTSIATHVIAAPTGVEATRANCSNARWMDVTVTWQPSTSARISGYEIKAYRDDGRVFTVATTGTGTTSATTRTDKHEGAPTTYTFTVTTLTSSGWTSPESLPSGSVTC
ncbi:fibronectin type III domain-containing protein [Geodermatophilus ruber]|uniref:Fibronectin type-III domain-containing protein n=1 Tax=Geodermatophilus ruber TaxID=504800 RepID=A0A1I4JX49_9ACTN|nr:hypothetical protein [Geodermatophilus ruber]SFL71145.1 hypothetical protein SAMN04488085_1163 [Geodermatophilus ruber]